MAHCSKMTKAACGNMFKHYERARNERGEYVKFGNESIDVSRSHLNYNLAEHQKMSQGDFVKQRCSEVRMQNRKDVNVMCSWVVTAPKDLPQEDEKKFFERTYDFLVRRYGKENVISAYVHMDEVTPHMHFAFVPVVKDQKRNDYKVSAKEAINRTDLRTFHKDLSAHLEREFGREIGILNEATREGNKSIKELKRQSAVERLAEASRIVSNAREQAECMKLSIAPQKVEYEARRAFIEQATRDSDVSVMYPDYAEISKRGLINKKEYVTVPREKWEAKHVAANQISALKRECEALKSGLDRIQRSTSFEEVSVLKQELEKSRSSLQKLRSQVERINNVFRNFPEIAKQFVKAEKEMQREQRFDRGLER